MFHPRCPHQPQCVRQHRCSVATVGARTRLYHILVPGGTCKASCFPPVVGPATTHSHRSHPLSFSSVPSILYVRCTPRSLPTPYDIARRYRYKTTCY
ncbi:hypothetical protein BAUCODRAFT_464068 [Baudoinia panamericana UAMH 10762]|uniref:Uncharacterized protein n=1 Tax=Baudoinia panamericana (strain UAMH 10762) TaxID=717646 RepID=M2LT90_BAUPA|nr:uncharacterized protein BAUCODRAFT_464068 [Baudoinia panamericana UAMH 10762]EMC97742.1 hypothetical protein BAUCODRAFT_464068 [Baudoinia panamericana UAMH 10762]